MQTVRCHLKNNTVKVNRKFLILIFTMGIWTNLFAQKNTAELKTFKNSEKKYSIKYPENWEIKTDEDGIVSIEPKNMEGGIYISAYNGITFPDEKMNSFILESSNLSSEYEDRIGSGEENGIKSWYLSYTDSNNTLTCMRMWKRKGDNLWFVSTEIEPKYWKKGWKDVIVKILTSFEIN